MAPRGLLIDRLRFIGDVVSPPSFSHVDFFFFFRHLPDFESRVSKDAVKYAAADILPLGIPLVG